MADQDGSSLHEQEASSDIETIIPAREDVPRVRVDDVDSDAATDLQTEDGGGRALSNRYREILRARHDEGSEISSTDAESVDAPPKRSDSPIESVLSHDQSPSIQVCLVRGSGHPTGQYFSKCRLGIGNIFSGEQCPPLGSLATWPRQSYAILPTLR